MITVSQVTDNGIEIPMQVQLGSFPTGEPHVFLDIKAKPREVKIKTQGFGSGEFLQLLHLLDLFRGSQITLEIPFFPGARQDRREQAPLSAKVFAEALNHYPISRVVVHDPHSDVTPALIKNVDVITLNDIFTTFGTESNLWSDFRNLDGLISPDAGASKKVEKLGSVLGLPTFQCSKIRDTTTGALSGFSAPIAQGKRFGVVDDICDGGGTFIGLAKAWQEVNPDSELYLYVTHGIFSKGLLSLFDHYRRVHTTNSFDQAENIKEFKSSYFQVTNIFEGNFNE